MGKKGGRMKRIAYLFLLAWLCCGCTLPREVDKDTVLRDEQLAVESTLPESEPEEDSEEAASETEEEAEEETSDELTDEKKAQLMHEQQDLYAFSTLEVTQQNLYVEVLYALTGYVEEMEVSTLDTEELDRIFQCVLMDHPEIFYADGYSFVKYTLGDEVKKITFTGTYTYDREEKADREAGIEAQAQSILAGISASASDYDKVKYVYETIIDNTEYDLDAEDNQNICSVFLGHRSVCQGYAKAVQYLLQKLDIPATLIVGTVENGEGHAWNLVMVEGDWYYVDATWGDASYQVNADSEGLAAGNLPKINYDYLCVTTEDLLRTHTVSDLVPVPRCTSLAANYYVREGAYFQSMDEDQLTSLIDRYQQEGRETVTLKCQNDEVYQQVVTNLLDEQGIFSYLHPEDNSILYTDSPKQLSITFWL
jgi:hypothetical protein